LTPKTATICGPGTVEMEKEERMNARMRVVAALLAVLACSLSLRMLAQAGEEGKAEEGWRQLFNGKDLTGWKGKQKGGWLVKDGALTWQRGCGYIWSEERFGDFVLDLEFKLSKGCNSGIFIRTDPRNAVQGGIEVQMLDSHARKPNRHSCGAIYDALAPTKNTVKKADEWNHITITCNDNKIEVKLNGEQIIDMDLNLWTEARRNPDGSRNKFRRPLKDFAREGHIGFQDHGRACWYRNIRIKVLEKERKEGVQ